MSAEPARRRWLRGDEPERKNIGLGVQSEKPGCLSPEPPAKVPLLIARHVHDRVAFLSPGVPAVLRAAKPDSSEGDTKIGACLRKRRRELSLSREAAAVWLATSEHTLRRWETGRTPLVSAYPKVVEFLGYEPWQKPTSLAGQIRAARWRRGLRIGDAAKLLGVEASTFWWWETGRKPHRLKDRARIADFVAGATGAPVGESIAPETDRRADQIADIGSMLRSRRKELGLTLDSAAKVLGANTWTILHWERGRHVPACRFFPSVIRFLGREPWAEPRSIADRLRAERLRRGLSCSQIAAVLDVDEGSIGAWESGDGPHHELTRAKVEAFLAGLVRPWRRRGAKGREPLT